jgi:hypothetical protein
VNLADPFLGYGPAATQAAIIDPFLDLDVRLGLQLQIALAGVLAIVVLLLRRPLLCPLLWPHALQNKL